MVKRIERLTEIINISHVMIVISNDLDNNQRCLQILSLRWTVTKSVKNN